MKRRPIFPTPIAGPPAKRRPVFPDDFPTTTTEVSQPVISLSTSGYMLPTSKAKPAASSQLSVPRLTNQLLAAKSSMPAATLPGKKRPVTVREISNVNTQSSVLPVSKASIRALWATNSTPEQLTLQDQDDK